MGTLIRENKRKIALSLNMGLLLMGCLMLTIGAYPALYSGGANETRLSIGATCIAFWFISFPALSRETKEKKIVTVSIHAITAFSVLIIFSWEIHYILVNWKKVEKRISLGRYRILHRGHNRVFLFVLYTYLVH